jgi:hypothetical protein
MIVVMTVGKFKKICQRFHDKGVARGYVLGYTTAKAEKTGCGCIIGAKVDEQVKEILRKSGYGE